MESKRATGWYNKYMDEMKKIGTEFVKFLAALAVLSPSF